MHAGDPVARAGDLSGGEWESRKLELLFLGAFVGLCSFCELDLLVGMDGVGGYCVCVERVHTAGHMSTQAG